MTPKQQRFVEEYLIDLNATQAALRAGYSEKTAYSVGHENLKKPEVQEAIQAAMAARSERTEITVDNVLRELALIGFQDVRQLFTPGGALLPAEDWPDEIAAAVSSVEVVTRMTGERDENDNPVPEYVHKIRTWDKRAALVDIGKHLGMFPTTIKGNLNVTNDPLAALLEDIGRDGQARRRVH